MLKHWTTRRKASLIIHGVYALGWLVAGAVAAWSLWYELFQDGSIATLLVATVEVLALVGLGCALASIPSPFQRIRLVLPYISVLPLSYEAYKALAWNGPYIAGAVVVIVGSLMIYVSNACWTTIEALFISPVEAAKERAREQVTALKVTIAQLNEIKSAAETFAHSVLDQKAHPSDNNALPDALPRNTSAQAALTAEAPTLRLISASAPVDAISAQCPHCGRALRSARARGAAMTNGGCCAECRAEQAEVKAIEAHQEVRNERTIL